MHNPFDSALYTMVNLNVQRFLLSLLPVIADQPAPILLAPAFAAAVSDDGGIFFDEIPVVKTAIYIAAELL